MMLHLRISGMVRAIGFAYGVSLVNIVVAIAWFGVNLLNVGLHSYGFTDNVAMNLFYFILIEISITSFMYVVAKKNIKFDSLNSFINDKELKKSLYKEIQGLN